VVFLLGLFEDAKLPKEQWCVLWTETETYDEGSSDAMEIKASLVTTSVRRAAAQRNAWKKELKDKALDTEKNNIKMFLLGRNSEISEK